jgi:hypothetical protein
MCYGNGLRVIAVLFLVAAAWVAPAPQSDSLRPPADDVALANSAGLRARIVAKAVVARELFAGRLSLAEATAVFAYVNGQRTDEVVNAPPPAESEAAARAVLEWSKSSFGSARTDSTIRERTFRLEEELGRASSAGPPYEPPPVNEVDCRELIERSAAAVRADRGRLVDRVNVSDLRLVCRPLN